MSQLLNHSLQAQRAHVMEAIKALHELAILIPNVELAKTISDLRNRLADPFMFVIVGEVKAGKSSFINALLETGREITKVAPQPMTDTIQQIVYGDEEGEVVINPYLKKILVQAEILKEIAIVDTPGTNTIVAHHQEITENFIPASDLIVFVFEAKNPYRQSAWDFLDFIHRDWHKKVIFVLQQKDLLSSADLAVNLTGVTTQAQKKGLSEPLIFSTSAKAELEGNLEESGFAPIRQYIRDNITGGRAPYLKLQNSIATGTHILQNIEQGLVLRQQQWEADIAFRLDITQTLQTQEIKSAKQVDNLVENILAAYDRSTQAKTYELQAGLSFFSLVRRSVAALFSRQASASEWLENLAKSLETELNRDLRQKLNEGITDLADSVQQMAKLIELKIRSSVHLIPQDHEVFSAMAERRHHIFKELQEKFEDFIRATENFSDRSLFPDKSPLPGGLATGSGLAVVGVILAAITQGAVFDITGGILTTIGLLFAGVTTNVKRRKILQGFQEEILRGRQKIATEVAEQLKTYIKRLKDRIDSNFDSLDLMLEKEKEQLERLRTEHHALQNQFAGLEQGLAVVLRDLA